MVQVWASAVVMATAGPLLVGGLAKLLTPVHSLAWPFMRGVLRLPHGPRVVGIGELAAATLITVMPGRIAALIAALSYGSLTMVSYMTRGQRCSCFGAAHLAAIGRLHMAANGAAAFFALTAALVTSAPVATPLRIVGTLGSAAVTVLIVVVVDRRRRLELRHSDADCQDEVSFVRVYVSDSCPSCRSLQELFSTMEPARQDALEVNVVTGMSEMPKMLNGLGVPCAIGLGHEGGTVCAPVTGIGPVKALVDRVKIGMEKSHSASDDSAN